MFRILLRALLLAGSAAGTVNAAELPAAADEKVDFQKQIQPIFAARCLDCHGELTQESHLRLDRKASLIRGGDSGEPAILTGNSAESHLIKLVAGLEKDLVMPPDADERLSAKQISLLRAWIDQGAVWPGPHGIVKEERPTTDHWSFQPLQAVTPPQMDDPWIRNPIDAFILEKLRERKIGHSPPAPRSVLIRRMYLDVLGLPPSPEEVKKYVENKSSTATDDLIERVLESSHYGERWARHWLDLVRFAETHGFETNRERPNAWRYRDYVIESLNEDKPYDQFIREQIAGDSYGNQLGLGYLVAGPYDQVKSPDVNLTLMQRHNELDDMINTTGTALLGLTIGCARCHNHKFDPITQTDYYSLQAIFAGVNHGDTSLPLDPQRQEQLAAVDKQIQSLKQQLTQYQIAPKKPNLRPAVRATGNTEKFELHPARFVRFTILATNSSQPCIDELAVFSGDKNVALAANGSRASSSSNLPGYEIHKLEHINDGKSGNSFSWISNEPGAGWVQIEFPEVETIDRIEWARDREGKYADRLATRYRIESSIDGETWKTIAGSDDRLPFQASGAPVKPEYRFDHLPEAEAAKAKALLRQLQNAEQEQKRLAETPQAYAGQYSQPGPTYRLYRGEPAAKREEVTPDVPALFADLKLPAETPEKLRRKALADWIASPQNPLTARVIVNRVWQFHFGQPLVATPSDFGEGGVPPTHPELLDWLAQELIAHNWSLKHIHRLILQSAAYQQSSRPDQQALQIDSATQYLWRYPPHRLEAEPIRDSILSVSGVLNLEAGGPGFSAFEVEAENVRHYHPKTSYGPEDWRRMIYMTKVRMEQDSVFGLFDCPDAATSVPQRSTSTTPLQALNLFNSPFLLQQAKLFAERLEKDANGQIPQQVQRGYELCFARQPTSQEAELSRHFIEQHGLKAFCRALLNSNEFLFIQ